MPRWTIDRKIPFTIILTIVFQLFAVISWATYLDARVNMLEARTQSVPQITESLARMEERMEYIRGDIAQIRHQIDKMGERIFKQ